MKKVEILYFEGCPNAQPAIELAERVVDELGVDASVCPVRVDPRELPGSFRGSPTVLVDGRDVMPVDGPASEHLSCRIYGAGGLPPRERIEAALTGAGR